MSEELKVLDLPLSSIFFFKVSLARKSASRCEKEKKTIPLPGGAELVKLAMSTNTGSVQPTGSATVLRLQ